MDTKDYRLSAILSIDIPGLSFSGESEEEASLIEASHNVIQTSARAQRGELIKAIGDSFLLSFANCQDAVTCALDIGEKLGSLRASSLAPTQPLQARMGIHLGDVGFFGKNIFGDAVDTAAALQAAAVPGTLCVSGEVLSFARETMGLDAKPLPVSRRKALPPNIQAYEISAASAARTNAEAGQPASGPSLGEIRRAILEEIRIQGRRLTVAEALRKFGWYGVEATEVIASMAESGILIGEKRGEYRSENQGESRRPAAPGYTSANAAGDLGRSIESAIHSIVSEIERAVETGKESGFSARSGNAPGAGIRINFDKDSFKESARDLKEVGRELKRQIKGGKNRDPSRTVMPSTAAFNKYRSELSTKAGKIRRGLIADILSFLTINPILWYINLNYASGFRWAPIVTIFWGFGVVESILSAFRVSRQAREAEALPDLDESQTKELKSIHKARDSIGKHFLNALSIPAGLFYLNMTFDKANPWFIIPTAIFAVTFVIHLIGYMTTGPGRSRRFFEKLGIGRRRKDLKEAKKRRESVGVELGAYAEIYRSAQESAMDIEASLSSSDPKDAAEMKPQLEGYLKQVLLLAKTANELDAIIGEIPMADLEKDKAALRIKLEGAQVSMKTEYEGSIAEIEKQEESFKALAEQREVIDLRLRSSVSQLQQLKMELARAKAFDAESDTGRKESAL
ncbi:MAG: hypothetical protein CVV53_08110, partial [Spirochaetae bacterium HGW-Spirochaetae-9]